MTAVFLDLDGTIIGADGTTADCVWEAASRAREAGIRLSACTGRPGLGVARRIAKRLGPTTPHIFQNGAVIAYPDGELLQVTGLKETATRALIERARDLGLVLELYTPTSLYVERKTDISEAHSKLIGITALVSDLNDVAASEPVIRAQWVIESKHLGEVRKVEAEETQIGVATSPAMADTYFVSVTKAGVSKGSAVRQVTRTLKVDPGQAMAIGDSVGDLSMLEAVGFPVVMGGAPEELKERFPATVPDVENCGAAVALEQALASGGAGGLST